MTEQEEYEQYLRETGQKPAAPKPADPRRIDVAGINTKLYGQPEGPTEEQYNAAFAGGLSAKAGGLMKLAPSLGKSGLGRVATPWIEGGVTGAAQNMDDPLAGFLQGAGTQGLMSNAGQALGKIGDVGMQVAVGRKKYTPGVGEALADEGLWGTQGMMKKQTDEGMSEAYGEMLEAAKNSGPLDSRQIGRQVYEDYTGPMTGRGRMIPSSADTPKIMQAAEFADDIKSRGNTNAMEGLERRKAAGKRAYSEKTGDGRSTPIGEMSKKEQILYSDALKRADRTAKIDPNTNEVVSGKMMEADKRYAALKRAERGLSEEQSLTTIGRIARPVQMFGAPLTSTVGQVGVKGGRGLEKFLAPLTRQAVVSSPKTPEEQEREEYEQYLRETGQK